MLKDVTLNSLSAAEAFVNRSRNSFWRGWDIVTHIPNDRAYMHKRGVYNRTTGRWGFEYVYPVTSEGKWNVKVYARGAK